MTDRPHLQLLGAPELMDQHGQGVRFQSKKHLGLLIYLTLESASGAVTRERLAQLLWEGPTKNPLHSLSQGLSNIRSILGSDAFAADRTRVRLQTVITTDLDLYSLESLPHKIPTPFEGLEDCAGPNFALWVGAKRDHALMQIETTLRDQLREARAFGRVQAVSERAEQLYNLSPHDEEAVQALIGDRVYSGNMAAAIRLFQQHAEDSRTDLGRPPSVETMASLRRLERRVWEHPQHGDIRRVARRPLKTQPEVLIGRESQMARLDALSNQLFASAQFRSCVLRGPDGVGKTTVLRRFVSSAVAGVAPVYMVNCQKIGQSLPFAALSDLLEQMSRDPALSGTHPMWLSEASRIAPGISAAYDGIPDPPVTQPETARVRLGQALSHILESVADGGPVILAFDDLHYMDPASRDVLNMLTRRLDGTPTLLLATVRSSETDTGIGGGEGIDGVDWKEIIDLQWLENSEVADLVSTLTKSDEAATESVKHKLVELAEGSPLLTEMLVADWQKNGEDSLVMVNIRGVRDHVNWCPPDTMRTAFARQYEGISKCAQRLVSLLATAGRCMPLEDICRLLAVPSETVGGAVFSLLERSIVSLDGNALGFKNDMHRTFVYSSLPDETRKYQHAHLAQHLRAAKDQSEFQHALEASHHFLKAEWVDEATELACLGADRAITCGAPKEAVKALEAVIAANPKSTSTPLHLFLARALAAVGQYKDALNTLNAWQPSQPTQHEEALAAIIRVEALHRGRLEGDEVIAAATTQAIEAADLLADQRLFLKTQQIAAEVAHESGSWDVVERIELECDAIEQRTDDAEVKGLAYLTLGYCRLATADPAEAVVRFSRSAEQFRTLRLDSQLHRALTGVGISASNVGRFRQALAAFSDAADAAARIGDVVAHANAFQNLGSLSNELGRFARGTGYFRTAIDLDNTVSTSRVSTALYCNAANLSIAIGNYHEAESFLQTAAAAAHESQLWHHFVNVHLTGADLHLAKGNEGAAWVLVEEALEKTGERHRLVPDLGQYWRLRHHYHLATGVGGAAGNPSLMNIAHVLELRAFDEWKAQQDSANDQSHSALNEMADLGLFGVMARLASVGVRYGCIQSASAEMTGAETVVDAFPDQQWEDIPTAVLG